MKLKSTFFKGFGALAMVAGCATNSSAYTLEVGQHGEGTLYEAYGPSGDCYFIFQVEEVGYFNEETQNWEYAIADEAYLRRISGWGNAIDLELPSHITFTPYNDSSSQKTVPVTCLGYPYEYTELEDCHNINLIVPETYTQLNSIFQGTFAKIKLLSSNPPLLWNCGSNVAYIVPDDAYYTYLEYKKNGYNGWNGKNVRTVNVQYLTINNTAGNLLNELESQSSINGDLSSVYALKITGVINGRDMNVISQLSYLENLDLSEVSVIPNENGEQYFTGCRELRYLETVILPSNVTRLDDQAFYYCTSLKNINLENITSMGSYAFYGCRNLESVDISRLTSIPYQAFNEANKLSQVKLADKIKMIDSYAFSSTALNSFNIPENAELGTGILRYTPITELTYYHNNKINGSTFEEMYNLQTLNCLDPIPHNGNFYLSDNNTVLKVPAFALNSYKNNTNYYSVLRIEALDQDIENLSIYNGNLTIDTTDGLASSFNMEIGKDCSFINESGKALNMNNFVQYSRYGASTNYEQTEEHQKMRSGYFISNNKAEAKSIEINLALMNSSHWSGSNAWNFISFPFNVNVNDIITPDDALWAIREYNGAERAANPYDGNSKWINKTSGTLEAGKGYIIHFSADNTEENIWGNGFDYGMNYFKFPAVKDNKMNNLFAYQNVKVPLNFYDSEFEHNKSWNLIGNPFDSYYDINGIQYSNKSGVTRVPITLWRKINGSFTYEAFSADDDFTLLPFEAFFVQAIDDKNLEMLFNADGRITSELSTRALTRAADPVEGSNRSIFNLYISNENSTDRTRLVINENASIDYEITCDASKFLAPDEETVQIYMLEKNEKLAINERPFGIGYYKMGVRIGEKGIYTISCNTRNAANYDVILVDTFTGQETSLTKSEYSFNAEEGSDSRFMIKLVASTGGNGETTGIDEVENNNSNISINGQNLSVSAQGVIEVYTIDGKVVASGNEELNVTLPQGLYIIKTAEESVKAVIR